MDCPRKKQPSFVPRPVSKAKPKAAKVEIDVVHINSLKSGKLVRAYYDRVVKFLCGGSQRNFIRWCKKYVKIEEFIVFVKFELNGQKVSLLIRGYDIYIGGFMLENGNCFLLDRAMLKFDTLENIKTCSAKPGSMLKPPEDNDLFAKCLREHGMEKLFTLPIGDSYRYLEGAARQKRECVDIGVKELEEAFKTLANYDKGETVKELEGVAKALLFFTQFLCEAVRIIPQAEMIIGAFNSNEAIRIPDWILLLHHGWGFASFCKRRIRDQKSLAGYELRTEKNGEIIEPDDLDVLFRAFVEGHSRDKKPRERKRILRDYL